jgi:error-prone DNA polymerase
MRRNGYSDEFAEQIYRQILGFGEYGFPESHAASFALLTYVSCWLKCHEPAAFFAALLNSQPMGFYQPAQLLQEARRAGVNVLPPDACVSEWDYTLETGEDGRRRSASGCDRCGLWPKPMRSDGRCTRTTGLSRHRRLAQRAALNRRAISALAAGALPSLGPHRHTASGAQAVESLPPAGRCRPVEPPASLPSPGDPEILADYHHLG